ncbi:MAG: hypothetical protein RL660_2483 [Bacteroidota bacterium]|jgi:hypothetical protein
MAIKKFAVACYDTEDTLFPAIKKLRGSGYRINDVYTPFPVHGLDHALGQKETDLHIAGFCFGITGTSIALGGISWILTHDWPQNFGGKPAFALPAWIPIIFELTVLCAAVGMVLTWCYLNQVMPGVKKHVFHPRQSDDLFVLTIEVDDNNAKDVEGFLKTTSPVETNVQVAEEDWWYGRWDRKEDYEIRTEQAELV